MWFFILEIFTGGQTRCVKNLTFVSGQRGSAKLVFDGYSYVRNKGNFTTTYWRCSKMRSKKCKAKIVTNRADNKVSVTHNVHNHAPDFSEYIDASV